jgi:hypothetical protein
MEKLSEIGINMLYQMMRLVKCYSVLHERRSTYTYAGSDTKNYYVAASYC